MKRFISYCLIGLMGFAGGLLARNVNPFRRASVEPLLISISSVQKADERVGYEHYLVNIRNVSDKTVRGFSLGRNCDCYSFDEDNRRYPVGITYSNPLPERQILRPGESVDWPIASEDYKRLPQPIFWADLVHFADGTNWGPNRSHKEGYVRN